MDIVDALVDAALHSGARIETSAEVSEVRVEETDRAKSFIVETADGKAFDGSRLVIATGGLSYPTTGSTGDGYRIARELGHSIRQCFPSLTALVPEGYKLIPEGYNGELKCHIDRSIELSETGKALCGNSLKNTGLHLEANGTEIQEMEGDIDFTDGGIEGPAGICGEQERGEDAGERRQGQAGRGPEARRGRGGIQNEGGELVA